jgi:hypothetical protein
MTKKHLVTARRWEHGWELHVDGVGVTQSASLADAERMARDYLATELGGEPEDYAVEIRHDLGGAELEVEAAHRQMADARAAVDAAANDMRRLVRQLRGKGISVRDTAMILHVSPGRVSQLATGNKKTRKNAEKGKVRRVA